MKRKDRLKTLHQSESATNQVHTEPDESSTGEQKRKVSGSLNVRGEITSVLSPEETLARKTSTDKQNSKDKVKRNTEFAMLFVVTLYTIFAGWQSYVANRQWHDLRHNFETEQRSWLKVETIMPPVLEADSITTINISNLGKSPALALHGEVVVQLVKAHEAPSRPHQIETRQIFTHMVFPGDSVSFQSGRTPGKPDGMNNPLTPDELQRLASGEAYLVAFGEVAYKDQFGLHWVRFCNWKSYQTADATFHANKCVDWNATGDGPIRYSSPDQENEEEH